ncbi:lanC-like protein 3 [Anneissia japonica]|uniref:lanC-like protein 3 n=1 Tax=Anneissia japonica TaxID=1529436 RepID=UPI0014256BFC|nr:lanC-like protein 3 [Anneissia japonica]
MLEFSMMASKPRYFQNHLADYNGQDIANTQSLHEYIKILAQKILSSLQASDSNCNGGIYVGVGGVAYALADVVEKCVVLDKKTTLIGAKHYLDAALQYEQRQSGAGLKVGFLLGTAGVFTAAAQYHSVAGNEADVKRFAEMYASLSTLCIPVNQCIQQAEEILVGRAGYLSGILFFQKKLGVSILSSETINSICSSIIQSGRDYANHLQVGCPLMYQYYGSHCLGAAHGISGILQILLSFPDFLKADPTAEKDIRASVDFLLALQNADPLKNIATVLEEANKRSSQDALVHWCHGAPGVVYMFAKAYLTWKDDRYLKACLDCGDTTWKLGLLRKGPGICHGVAGSGYVHLLLYRLTQNKKHLHRAMQFANFMFSDEFNSGARTPDNPYSLYEGVAGTLCFLVDLLQPEKASFPFFDIF